MSVVVYYTLEAVDELRDGVGSRVEWYLDGGPDPIALISPNPTRQTRIAMGGLVSVLKTRGRLPGKHDGENALVVYRALDQLTPYQASDQRLWTYLAHNECAGYIARRWLRGGDEARMVDRIRNHFFVNGNRGLIRDNGISRLWWLGFIAHKVVPEDPSRFLEVVLYRQDPRSALIERPSVSRNYRVLRCVYCAMEKDFRTRERRLFERDVFRDWMKRLNRQGGMQLLDALSDTQLEGMVLEQADKALGD